MDFEVICNDGTKDVGNGAIMPCTNHGGVKKTSKCPEGTTEIVNQCKVAPCSTSCVDKDGNTVQKSNNTNKWLAIIGLTAVAYFILYKSGSLK
jgi:hypothetical protein